MDIRKYYVNAGMRTNLETMLTKIELLEYDMIDNTIHSVELMDKVYDLDNIGELKDELRSLITLAYDKVTGKEYGRIKQISDYRDCMRYATCIDNGLSEEDSSYAFLGR